MPGLEQELRSAVWYFSVFPNPLLSVHPDYVMTHLVRPLAPDRTAVTCGWLFPPDAFDRPGFDSSYAVDFWDITNRQDWAGCEGVQRGVAGLGYRQGPFSGTRARCTGSSSRSPTPTCPARQPRCSPIPPPDAPGARRRR
jgi:Rieske 2Fe-2S family protein